MPIIIIRRHCRHLKTTTGKVLARHVEPTMSGLVVGCADHSAIATEQIKISHFSYIDIGYKPSWVSSDIC